jgi:hypothetical protein
VVVPRLTSPAPCPTDIMQPSIRTRRECRVNQNSPNTGKASCYAKLAERRAMLESHPMSSIFPLFTVANTPPLDVLLLSRRSWPPQNAGIRASNGLLCEVREIVRVHKPD